MIKGLISLMVLLVAVAALPQGSTTTRVTPSLAWDPNPEPDIAGYIIHTWYIDTNGDEKMLVVYDVGNTNSVPISTVIAGHETTNTLRFRATAYNTSGLESDLSNAVDWNPNRPSQPQVKVTYEIDIKIEGQ